MDTKILDELEAAWSEEFNLAGDGLGALEQAVQAKIRQLGQGLLQRLGPRWLLIWTASSVRASRGPELSIVWQKPFRHRRASAVPSP